jgi:predicted transcriptional regulator
MQLTKAEEQIMQVLWDLEKGFVKDIIEKLPEPKPAYNTVATFMKILKEKGFVDYNAYGKTYEYFPLVSKSEYSNSFLKNFLGGYFGGSFEKMVSFFVKQNDMDLKDVEDLMKHIKKDIQ